MKLLLTTACFHLVIWTLPATAQVVFEEARLSASDARAGDLFGGAVSLSGDTAVIGAFQDFHNGSRSGSAYVFVRQGTVWLEDAKLTAGDAEDHDRFGRSVSISGDTVVVSAPLDDDACPADPECDSGSAYVFVRQGTDWTQQAKLTASDAVPRALFGSSVSIFEDTIVVAAHNRFGPIGSAYVFARDATTWTEQAKLTGSSDPGFAASTAIHQDTIVVGEWEPSGTAARVFTRDGTTWSLQEFLTAPSIFRGNTVSVHGDRVVVGDWLPEEARVFERSGTTWGPGVSLTVLGLFAEFGRSVAVEGDTCVVGASCRFESSCPGSAYVIRREGVDWIHRAQLLASDGVGGDLFGMVIALEGTAVLVGAPNDDHVSGEDAGSVYVFSVAELPPGTASCFGVGCPCGNDDPVAGCANSTGLGGLLAGTGSPSAGDDDLVLQATQLPPNNQGLVYMADGVVASPFSDGIQCAFGATMFRFRSEQDTGPAGALLYGPGIVGASFGRITAGTTWHFHVWHRDFPGSPCGTSANLTNMYTVTFGP